MSLYFYSAFQENWKRVYLPIQLLIHSNKLGTSGTSGSFLDTELVSVNKKLIVFPLEAANNLKVRQTSNKKWDEAL